RRGGDLPVPPPRHHFHHPGEAEEELDSRPLEGVMQKTTRRDFLKQAAAGATLAALTEDVLAQTSTASATGIPPRPLGRTGQRVSILALGGWHIGAFKDDAESIRLMQAAL